MNINGIAQRTLGHTEMFLKKNAPAILTGVGVVGFGATTVLVGKAVLKSQGKVAGFQEKRDEIGRREISDDYSEADKAKEMGTHYIHAGMDLGKVFWPAITVGGLSVICVCASHGLMKKRQTSLLAAYATIDAGFKAYRRRIQEELGDDRELDIYRGVRGKTTIESLGDDDNCVMNEYGDVIPSPYARFFDESSVNWTKTPEYNMMFLRSQQQWANDRLKAHGFIYLNEIYEALGLPRSQVGQIVGWKLNGDGDGFVDFGMYDIFDECNRAFVNGIETSVLLDFNVDGPIQI